MMNEVPLPDFTILTSSLVGVAVLVGVLLAVSVGPLVGVAVLVRVGVGVLVLVGPPPPPIHCGLKAAQVPSAQASVEPRHTQPDDGRGCPAHIGTEVGGTAVGGGEVGGGGGALLRSQR